MTILLELAFLAIFLISGLVTAAAAYRYREHKVILHALGQIIAALSIIIYMATDDPAHTKVSPFAWISLHIGLLLIFTTRSAMKEYDLDIKRLRLFRRQ